ncbi:MAG: pyruvate kinase [Deltaproteobacteria bacterium]|nr:pyruvate kinase [Deltaproteobacteria bacterium]
MKLPAHKSKIVCTIGPASRSKYVLKRLITAGMNVARLNFSHGDLNQHREDIESIRSVSKKMGKAVAILADLPGPKIRIGSLAGGALPLRKGDMVVLTADDMTGSTELIPVQYKDITKSVKKRDIIYLNDGFIQLRVTSVDGAYITCKVIIGGTLLSNKGINLPNSRLTVDPVTDKDLELIDFGLKCGVDAFGVSFIQSARDILKVKDFVEKRGKSVFVIAKIERKEALQDIDEILRVSDGIMIARGDLGVEIPIENIPVTQKWLIQKANLSARPVITATQMLESMTENIRPTRAEVTDVANAILDGTDALMLSEETAIGEYPVAATKMLSRIARSTETRRESLVSGKSVRESIARAVAVKGASSEDVLSLDVIGALKSLNIRYVLAPTQSGGTARRISRYKSKTWIIAFCTDEQTKNILSLSYGIFPVLMKETVSDDEIISFMRKEGFLRAGERVVVARRLPHEKVGKTNSLKIITLR